MKVSITEIDDNIKSGSIIIDKSTVIELNKFFYQIKCKEYIIDKDGYIALEFEKRE